MEAIAVGWASNFRAWGWAGYKMGDKRATLAGASLIPDSANFFEYIRNKVERNLRLSAFDMDEQTMAGYIEKLNRYKPRFLRAYPSAAYAFANYLQETGAHVPSPHAILTDAEMLFPQQRRIIESQFGCEIFDGYGCRDGAASAGECDKHKGYHISSEQVVIEFIKDGRPADPGESAELVLTDLYNYAMPFIRYVVGDVGALSAEKCSCGRNLPLLQSLQGRISDCIVTPSGKKIHGEFFSHVLWGTPIVLKFQVIQETQDSLRINLVPQAKATIEELTAEKHRIADIISRRTENMNINLEYVDEIPTTKAGKWKFIISDIAKGNLVSVKGTANEEGL
jgi:phenylacetate-CoA ligase